MKWVWQHGLICSHRAQSSPLLIAVIESKSERWKECANGYDGKSARMGERTKKWNRAQVDGMKNQEQAWEKTRASGWRQSEQNRMRLKAKCEKLITMSLSHVSALLWKSLYAWPVTRHHLYTIICWQCCRYCGRHAFTILLSYTRVCFTFPSVFALHMVLLLFSFSIIIVFFIVSPSGCSRHHQHNDVIYDYVCTYIS